MATQRKTAKPAGAPEWRKTSVANLVQHRSGGYYARYRLAGKVKERSLDTDVFSVARLRLRERMAEVEGQRSAGGGRKRGIVMGGQSDRQSKTPNVNEAEKSDIFLKESKNHISSVTKQT